MGKGSPGFYVSWQSPIDFSAGVWINMGMFAGGVGQTACTRTRRRIGIYSSTKADLPASTSTMSEMALFNFQFSLAPSISKLLTPQYAPAADPAGGWPYPYMTSAQGTALIGSMRTSLSAYNSLYGTLTSNATDGFGADDIVGWRTNDATGARAMNWAGREYLLATINGMYTVGGNYALGRGYYELAYNPMLGTGGQVAMLQDSHTSSYLHTAAQRFLGFYCGWVWDPAYAPIDAVNTGESFGLADQATQAFVIRQIFSEFCTNQPYVKPRYLASEATFRQVTIPNWMDAFGDHTGVIRDSPHYVGATLEEFKALESVIAARSGAAMSAYESGLFTGQIQQEYGLISPCDIRFGPSCFRAMPAFGDAGYNQPDRCGTGAKFNSSTGLKHCWNSFASRFGLSFF